MKKFYTTEEMLRWKKLKKTLIYAGIMIAICIVSGLGTYFLNSF